MDKIALTSVTFRRKSVEEVCEIARKNGVRHIEWGGDVHLPPDGDSARILRAQGADLSALSYGSYYRLGSDDDTLFSSVLDSAKAIGAKTVRIWHLPISGRNVTRETFLKSVEEGKRLARTAKDAGLNIALEFHAGTYNDDPENSIRYIEAVGADNLRTYWQPLYAESDDVQILRRLLPYVVGVHVFYWKNFNRRYSLRRGRNIWSGFIKEIRRDHDDVPFIIEFVKRDSEKQFAKDVAVLRELLDGN